MELRRVKGQIEFLVTYEVHEGDEQPQEQQELQPSEHTGLGGVGAAQGPQQQD